MVRLYLKRISLLLLVGSVQNLFASGQRIDQETAAAPDLVDYILDDTDCANNTHRWSSINGSCFDETAELPALDLLPQENNHIGRYLGGLGHKPRDGVCGANLTACWIVNCCQPGEICGDITVGCIISWSTIYTTTISTMWSTVTDLITPSSFSRTTLLTTDTAYVTTTSDVTLSGAGVETVWSTSATTITTIILSAYQPTITSMSTATVIAVLGDASANTQPASITNTPKIKARGAVEKRTQRTSYTTLTVYVTRFSSVTTTATFTGSVASVTEVIYTTLTAVQTVNHYSTTTGFTTVGVNSTSTVSSYAFGTLSTEVLNVVTTRTLTSDPSSSVAASTAIAAEGQATSGAQSAVSHHTGLPAGAIAGIVVGVILLLLLLLALLLFCCCRRRRRERREQRHEVLESPPLPPSPPMPMAMVNSPTLDSPQRTTAPMAGYASRPHGRKSSRTSIVSISPVPEEEDEDGYNSSSPENGVAAAPRRGSTESTRSTSWGRGYGGRGGYGAHGRGGGVYNSGRGDGNAGGNRQFRGVMTSTYSDGTLVPPHERK